MQKDFVGVKENYQREVKKSMGLDKIMEERKRRNQEICDAIRAKQYIPAKLNITQSWYPERKPIPKDHEAMERLYEQQSENTD